MPFVWLAYRFFHVNALQSLSISLLFWLPIAKLCILRRNKINVNCVSQRTFVWVLYELFSTFSAFFSQQMSLSLQKKNFYLPTNWLTIQRMKVWIFSQLIFTVHMCAENIWIHPVTSYIKFVLGNSIFFHNNFITHPHLMCGWMCCHRPH